VDGRFILDAGPKPVRYAGMASETAGHRRAARAPYGDQYAEAREVGTVLKYITVHFCYAGHPMITRRDGGHLRKTREIREIARQAEFLIRPRH